MNSESVLEIFREITKIPRESGHEEQMTAFLQKFAADRGLECKTDATGNVVIAKPASKGKEKVPTLVLQGHQDMVCEKNAGCDHDFAKDPIKYVIEDGWMVAKETTLGADDGIGVAACLALLDSDLPMGRIECLFTISEETGMDGAMALEPGFITGKTLINLDSEDEGQLFVGCAGGVNTMATFDYQTEFVSPGSERFMLRVYGAMGGHSGDDINKERCNTIQQLARFLYAELGSGFQLVLFKGGNKHNAIPRECEAIVALPDGNGDDFARRFLAFGKALSAEFATSDPGVAVECRRVINNEKAIESSVASRLLASLVAVHHGVLAMSQDIPGLVETSNNLAAVRMIEPARIQVLTSQRSSVMSALDFMAKKIEACFRLAGAEVVRTDPYPGWKPNMNSHILKVAFDSYVRLFGVEPEVKAIHAGLECGLFLEKFPDLDMISFGPTLRGVHAPGEKLDLASNEKFVKHLIDVVTNFS
ncbi:MAG: aminoacyl-histidine dipeptidase [Bacteroidales bacterium]|nr:aminoacyl-histidine dipeptidase [Bacteroidales bacterium]MCR5244295.1 aminoacyl-histidine dipeptidase [Bacteroidales bacterium]MDT3356860.1 aminoacyl-histidine dipeptidase [Bacteroidota bacterium]